MKFIRIIGCSFFLFVFIELPANSLEMKAGGARAVITPSDYQGRISVMGGALKGKEPVIKVSGWNVEPAECLLK